MSNSCGSSMHLVTNKEFPSTKFYDLAVATSILGYSDMSFFRTHSDWFKLLTLGSLTFPDLAREFIGTLTLNNTDDRLVDNFSIKFQILGTPYRLSIVELNEIYNIKHAECRTEYREFDLGGFWKRITGSDTYDPITATAAQIRNPTLRYLHYLIASTIFGRSHGIQRVVHVDLFALWCLTIGNHANMVYFMMQYFEDVAPYGNKIVIGGLITPILEYLGVKLDLHKQHDGSRKLDFSALTDLGMLSPQFEGGWFLHFYNRASIILPNFSRIRLDVEQNWLLEDDDQ